MRTISIYLFIITKDIYLFIHNSIAVKHVDIILFGPVCQLYKTEPAYYS